MFTKGHKINQGRVRSEEVRKKLSELKKGAQNPSFGISKSDEWKKNKSDQMKANHPMKGKKHSTESKKKMSKARMGRSPWNKGIGTKTSESKKIRSSKEYKLWREAVFERDDYTCVWCGARGGILHPDHIKPFAYFPELRLAIDNGRTLCRDCHKTTDTYAGKAKKFKLTNQTV